MKYRTIQIICLLGIAAAGVAQEKPVVSLDELNSVLAAGRESADTVLALRRGLGTEVEGEAFVREIARIQSVLEEAVVFIGTTKPEKENQLYAMKIAIGVKEIELALWAYLVAFMTNDQEYLEKADRLLREGAAELDGVD